MSTTSKSRVRALLGVTTLVVAGLVVIGLWGSRGHLPAFIDGQLDPGPALTDVDVSAHPPAEVVRVTVSVDSSTVTRFVDNRYLSFAIDTSAVVGGKWWDPKAERTELGSGTVKAPIFDFDRPRLDALTRALAPAYLRIGGSEADKVYYDLSRADDGAPPPPGYESVLTRAQWDAVNAFARRNRLSLVMTLNAGPSARDPDRRWIPTNAEALIRYTASKGYRVALWELGNELNLFWFVHGLSAQLPAALYADDLGHLRAIVARLDPDAGVSGQAAAFWPILGEPLGLLFGFQVQFAEQSGPDTDTFGWHYYPQQSRRGPIASRRATPGRLLDPDNLDEVAHWAEHNARLRDENSPGRPLWLSETGNAQFGGEPGLSDRYLASLWWLDQLGLLAVHHHDVVVRQTLSGSNYQLITDDTLEPLPDYWASLLWKRLMGPGVFITTVSGSEKVRVYAHQTPSRATMTILLINLDHQRGAQIDGLELDGAELYAATSTNLFGTNVRLNGETLEMVDDVTLPDLSPAPAPSPLVVHPLSYSFVVVAR